MEKITEIFIGGRYTNVPIHINELFQFCLLISNKIMFEIDLENYPLSEKEYNGKARKDFQVHFERENKFRIEKYQNDIEYKAQLLKRYHTEEEVKAYLNRLHDYDMIELEEIDKRLIQYTRSICKKKTKINYGANAVDNVQSYHIMKHSHLESYFTTKSHATMGSIYKVLIFRLNMEFNQMILKNNLLCKLQIGEYSSIENPSFYYDDRLIALVSTHEQHIVLYLNEKELETFRLLNITYL